MGRFINSSFFDSFESFQKLETGVFAKHFLKNDTELLFFSKIVQNSLMSERPACNVFNYFHFNKEPNCVVVRGFTSIAMYQRKWNIVYKMWFGRFIEITITNSTIK